MALPKLNTVTYDLDLPYTKKTIQYRPFVVGEQKILMMAMETRDEKQILSAMRQAVQACTNNTVDVVNMPLFELEWLFLNIRMKSVGEKTNIILDCPHCEAQNKVEIDLRTATFTQKDENHEGVIFLTDKVAVRMRMPSLDVLNGLKVDKDKESQAKIIFDLSVQCIDAILDEENEYKIDNTNRNEVVEFVDSLNTEQFIKIQMWFENMPILKIDIDHNCENCGKEMNTTIEGIANFF